MSRISSCAVGLCLTATAVWAGVANAHITLETQKAPAGSYYKAVLRVPHGCEGAATTAIRVQIPDGVVDVKPMPKAGWQLNMVKGKLAQPFTMEGTTIGPALQ